MNRTEKAEVVQALHDQLNAASLLVVAAPKGMTVAQSRTLRKAMRAEQGKFIVVKNTLARLALKGTSFESVTDYISGPIGFALSEDPVTAAKVIDEFAKSNDSLDVVCGATPTDFLDANGVRTLAKLPSLDALRSTLIGILNAPATRIATVLQAPAGDVARVLKAYAEKA